MTIAAKLERCYYCDKTNVDMFNRHGKWFCETCANDYDFGRFHRCESSEKGGAVDVCEEHFDGTLWVSNSEYSTQVNYCPFCGYMSPVYIP